MTMRFNHENGLFMPRLGMRAARLNLMRCVGSRANYAGPIKVVPSAGSRKAIPREHQIVSEQLAERRLGLPGYAF